MKCRSDSPRRCRLQMTRRFLLHLFLPLQNQLTHGQRQRRLHVGRLSPLQELLHSRVHVRLLVRRLLKVRHHLRLYSRLLHPPLHLRHHLRLLLHFLRPNLHSRAHTRFHLHPHLRLLLCHNLCHNLRLNLPLNLRLRLCFLKRLPRNRSLTPHGLLPAAPQCLTRHSSRDSYLLRPGGLLRVDC